MLAHPLGSGASLAADEIPTALIILDEGKPQSVLRCLVSLIFNYSYGLRTVEAASFEEARQWMEEAPRNLRCVVLIQKKTWVPTSASRPSICVTTPSSRWSLKRWHHDTSSRRRTCEWSRRGLGGRLPRQWSISGPTPRPGVGKIRTHAPVGGA